MKCSTPFERNHVNDKMYNKGCNKRDVP